MDGTNVACLFDLHVCYMCVLCFVRFAEEAESRRKVRLAKPHFATDSDYHNIMDDYNLQDCNVELKLKNDVAMVIVTQLYEETRLFNKLMKN